MYQMNWYLHFLHYSVVKGVRVQSMHEGVLYMFVEAFLTSVLDSSCKPGVVTRGRGFDA